MIGTNEQECVMERQTREKEKDAKSLQFVIEALTRPGAGIVDAYVFTCINHLIWKSLQCQCTLCDYYNGLQTMNKFDVSMWISCVSIHA